MHRLLLALALFTACCAEDATRERFTGQGFTVSTVKDGKPITGRISFSHADLRVSGGLSDLGLVGGKYTPGGDGSFTCVVTGNQATIRWSGALTNGNDETPATLSGSVTIVPAKEGGKAKSMTFQFTSVVPTKAKSKAKYEDQPLAAIPQLNNEVAVCAPALLGW